MTDTERQQFINALKRARRAVLSGNAGCATAPDRCWYCAMRYRAHAKTRFGLFSPSGELMMNEANWSLERPVEDTIALFDNSIAALERA